MKQEARKVARGGGGVVGDPDLGWEADQTTFFREIPGHGTTTTRRARAWSREVPGIGTQPGRWRHSLGNRALPKQHRSPASALRLHTQE
jgi:hypothetical protein